MLCKTLTHGLLLVLLTTSFGCIGITKSADMFLNSPSVGMTEIEMVMTYGAPAFSTHNGDTAVYVYKIVDRAYYVVYGYNDDIDMVIVCKGGKVAEVKKVKPASGMTILQPNTWTIN
jgi:hypothetical protein